MLRAMETAQVAATLTYSAGTLRYLWRYSGQRREPGRFLNDLHGFLRQQTERCHRVCRIRLCRGDCARRDLAPQTRPQSAPGGMDHPSRRASWCGFARKFMLQVAPPFLNTVTSSEVSV